MILWKISSQTRSARTRNICRVGVLSNGLSTAFQTLFIHFTTFHLLFAANWDFNRHSSSERYLNWFRCFRWDKRKLALHITLQARCTWRHDTLSSWTSQNGWLSKRCRTNFRLILILGWGFQGAVHYFKKSNVVDEKFAMNKKFALNRSEW